MNTPRNNTLKLGAGLLVALCFSTAAFAGDGIPGVGENGGPTKQLSPRDYRTWLHGRQVFDRDFTAKLGLGVPDFNGNSCRACHQDPVLGGAGGLELNVSRFGHDGGGLEPFTDLPGGQAVSKLRPPPIVTRENYPVDDPDPSQNADVFEQRQTPTLLGIGLIDGIPEANILANEDPFDVNGDGIMGVARIVTVNGKPVVGRFGWKAQIPHSDDFMRDAMINEIGITTPDDGEGFGTDTDNDAVPDPELSVADRDALVFFLNNLGPPAITGTLTAAQNAGKAVFSALRCDVCHKPILIGENRVRVRLFSDLLLHDVMGPGFRGMSEAGAGVGMYRTPPLWGIKDTAPYMHDGRAATLEEAILAHHGEGEFSNQSFQALTPESQANLIEFLKGI